MISLSLHFEEVPIVYQYSKWVKRMSGVSTIKQKIIGNGNWHLSKNKNYLPN